MRKNLVYFLPILITCLALPLQIYAAVAFGSVVNVIPATGTNTGASPSITTPATNPVVIVDIAINDATATVSSLTITGFGGTASEVKAIRATTVASAYASTWCIKAPTPSTSGTVQANFSASVPYQMSVSTYSGADQTTPCPIADAQSDNTVTNPQTLTPTNLTANDASNGNNGNAEAQDLNAITPTSDYLGNTTAINLGAGHATGTTGITFGATGTSVYAKVAVRIAEATGGVVCYQTLLGVGC